MAAQTEAIVTTPSGRAVRQRPLVSLPSIVAVLALLRALQDRLSVLDDPDTYLHIAAGRWIIAHHALPLHDPFSHSMAGATWVAHEWLSELLLAFVYDRFGWPAVALLAALCFAGALALLTRRLLAHFEPFSALIVVGASCALLLPHLVARAHVLAFPLLVVWSAGLISARDHSRAPPLWLLPVMTLWANLHGGFMFGLALAGFFGAEAVLAAASWSERRVASWQWGRFILLAVGAALCTPNGVDGLLLPFRIAAMPVLQQSFSEWMSPNFQRFDPLELWLLGMLGVGLALGLRLPLTRLLLLLGLFHMALSHVRHADFVALVAPLAIAQSVGPQLAARIRAAPPSSLGRWFLAAAKPAGSSGIVIALAVTMAISGATLLWPLQRADGPQTPGRALAAAEQMRLSGPVFNNESFGGYLVFSGVPTFIDGRIEMYGDAFLKRYLDAADGKESVLTGLLDQYGITWTLLQPQDHAVEVLDHLPGWRRVYADRYAVIHVRQPAP
ncbi:MAG TPA: hypothetical protein VMA53_13735 [Stellaceae bacterium]|nr:hypothetical protein [Stellaceae bacterium]